jgi:lanosterol synthase
MALMYGRYPHPEPLERAVKLVMSRQLPVSHALCYGFANDRSDMSFQDGSWPQEAIEGVFNKTCAIAYPNFKFSFPIWMLGKARRYLAELRADPASLPAGDKSPTNGGKNLGTLTNDWVSRSA